MGRKLNSMNLESPKIIVKKSSEEIYDFLIEIKNFEKLMPEGISKFDLISNSEFLFALKGMPEITLVKKSETPCESVVLGSSGKPLSEGKATFTWDGSDPDSGDTLTYTVYVDTVDGKQTPTSALSNLSSETVDVELEAATTYYWRVKTSDGTNASYSIIYSFKTQ